MTMEALLSHWPLTGPFQVDEATGGINNQSHWITAAEGRFLLRLYQNTADPERIRFEHAVLTGLAAQGLPFAVPAPVPTRSGAFSAALESGVQAALFRQIPGTPSEALNLDHARAAGQAQAHLHRAMARLGSVSVGRAPHAYGELYDVHPLVTDPFEGVRFAGVEPDRLVAELAALLPAVDRLYAAFPRQVIHADYSRGNLLLEAGQVTGVLDFEFACHDLRVADYATGLYPFALGHVETGLHWHLFDAYSEGYTSVEPLSPTEVEAVPTALRLVRVGSLLHWTGRTKQGLCSLEDLQGRAQRALTFLGWLTANEHEFLARLRRAHR